MQNHRHGPLGLFPPLFFCLSRSCLSQRSGVFRLRVLLSPQLCVSPATGACRSHGTVQGEMCGGLRVPAGPLPSPGTLSKTRRLSLFSSQTHLPVRGEDTAEMQHLVWGNCVSLFSSIFPPSPTILVLIVRSSFYFFTFKPPSVCKAGQWQCTGEKCASQCSLMGALQVTTFDKKRYSLQGGDCPFTAVEVRSTKSNNAQSQ